MAGDHWAKREQCNFAAWIKPKAAHNRFVNEILQTKRAPDLCFCAREAEARQGQEQQDRASAAGLADDRSEEHTSELQSLMRISYAVFCLKKKKHTTKDII